MKAWRFPNSVPFSLLWYFHQRAKQIEARLFHSCSNFGPACHTLGGSSSSSFFITFYTTTKQISLLAKWESHRQHSSDSDVICFWMAGSYAKAKRIAVFVGLSGPHSRRFQPCGTNWSQSERFFRGHKESTYFGRWFTWKWTNQKQFIAQSLDVKVVILSEIGLQSFRSPFLNLKPRSYLFQIVSRVGMEGTDALWRSTAQI